MSIRFGKWELVPIDGNNWTLRRLRTLTKGKNMGQQTFVDCYRFFQWNTIENAFIYAANEELMDRAKDEALTFQEYADELKRILDGFKRDIRETIKGVE